MDTEIEVNGEHIRRPNQVVLKMCIKDCAKDVFPAILLYHLMSEEPLNTFFFSFNDKTKNMPHQNSLIVSLGLAKP